MGDILVQYNGQGLSPTPIVNQNISFLDYGGRWGNIIQIELNGLLTGLSSTGSINNLTSIFASQFQTLNVYELTSGQTLIYTWPNVILDDITLQSDHYYSGSMVNYSIKLRSFNVPSGVTEPTNEYTFNENDDGTVNVNHKISARGIRTSGTALQNVINFVKLFTGKDPYTNCIPYFVPNGSGILLSQSENIDRLNGQYSVEEVYKYNTGQEQPYVTFSSLNISDNLEDEYLTLEYQIKFQGSPVKNNISTLNSVIPNFNIFEDISSYNIDTGLLVQYNFDITRDSGACSVDIKSSLISGYSLADLTGFLDYDILLEKDFTIPKESWRLEGDFICRGPLSYQQTQLQTFKNTYDSNWTGFLESLLISSPLYNSFHTSGNLLNTYPTISIQENTGLSTFKITFSIEDGGEPIGLSNPKYNIEVQPSKWLFELLPAANIEGHYVVQDLQMQTQSKIKFNLMSDSQYPSKYLPILSGNLSGLQNIYINTGFITSDLYETGILDMSATREWIGTDTISSGTLYTKVVGSIDNSYTRLSGFLFGY